MQRTIAGAALLLAVIIAAPATPALAAACKLGTFGTIPVEVHGTQPSAQLKVNGREARFLVDTGAWFGTMSEATAQALSLPLSAAPEGLFGVGVGGSFSLRVAKVKQLGLLGATLPNADFTVGGTDMGVPILGANILHYFDLELDLANGQMRFMRASGCGKQALAYWRPNGDYQSADLVGDSGIRGRSALLQVIVNGKRLRALLDTGASATVIGRRAANWAGLDVAAPGAVEGGASTGFGRKLVRTWTVRVESIAIGTETIKNARVQVIDDNLSLGEDGPDMLLGIDFILAHRILVAGSQGRMYFTYNGGPVFAAARSAPSPEQPAANSPSINPVEKDQPASFFAARATARQARGDRAGALADYDAAIQRAPEQAGYYLDRAIARGAAGRDADARADLAKALNLDPANGRALLMRARMHRVDHELDAALADVAAAVKVVPAGSGEAFDAADLYMAMQRPVSAIPLLDGWIALHPVDARLGMALNKRCWARGLANQQLDSALDDCRKAIKRDGANPAFLDSLGLIHLRRKAYADAILAYQQALALGPRQPWSHYGLGLARERAMGAGAGAADLAAALALDPEVEAEFRHYGI